MNIASVSWGDHLSFGDAAGRLATPSCVAGRMRAWRDELGASAIHWRLLRVRIPGRFFAGRGYRHPSRAAAGLVSWDDLATVPSLAQEAGLAPWLYVSVFDEGWPLAPPRRRAVSYHNAMHGQHVAWQSDLTRSHPEWVVTDRAGRKRQWGVVSLAYSEARRAFIERWLALIRPTAFHGLFVCLRSQSRPAGDADQFGFNQPAVDAFAARYGADVRREPYDVQLWRDHLGGYLTMLLAELREALRQEGRGLAVGAPRGDILGPPLGNITLHWREWVNRGLVDQLVVNQNSCRCPSMWHELWPMHRGSGYRENYPDGTGLPPVREHLDAVYGPALEGTGTRLFVARQWCERSKAAEDALASLPVVSGLVFSTFRHDNPEAVRRGDWRA